MSAISHKKTCLQIITGLILLMPFVAFAQAPFKLNRRGEVIDNTFKAFIAKNKYQAISAFDTVSKKPLLLYAQYIKNNKFGIMDIYGREVTKPIYDEILGLNKSYPVNTYSFMTKYVVNVDGKYGIIDNKGSQLLAPTLDFLFYENGSDSLYVTYKGNSKIYMDAKGNPVQYKDPDAPANRKKYVPEYDKTLNADKTEYSIKGNYKKFEFKAPNLGEPISVYNNRVIFRDMAKKYGVYDANLKKTIIPVIYDKVDVGINGYFVVQSGNKYGVIDSLGKIKCPVEFEAINRVTGCNVIYKDKKYAQYSKSFDPLSGFVYDSYGYLGLKVSTFKKNGKYGLVNNIDGKPLADFIYDQISIPDDHDLKTPLMIVKQNNKMGIIDYGGKTLLPPTYDLLLPESSTSSDQYDLHDEGGFFMSNQPNLYFFFKQNGKFGLLDNNFKVLVNNDYDMMIKSYPRTIINVRKAGKWGMLDISTKKLVIPIIYDQKVNSKQGGLLEVYQNRKYGLIDAAGKVVIPIENDRPVDFDRIYNGLIKIIVDRNTKTYIDYSGNKVSINTVK